MAFSYYFSVAQYWPSAAKCNGFRSAKRRSLNESYSLGESSKLIEKLNGGSQYSPSCGLQSVWPAEN